LDGSIGLSGTDSCISPAIVVAAGESQPSTTQQEKEVKQPAQPKKTGLEILFEQTEENMKKPWYAVFGLIIIVWGILFFFKTNTWLSSMCCSLALIPFMVVGLVATSTWLLIKFGK